MDYKIHTDIKYKPMELVEAGRLADDCTERWWNQTLSRVNDCVVRLGVFEGEFHWHKHDREDEFFFVLDGQLFLDPGKIEPCRSGSCIRSLGSQ